TTRSAASNPKCRHNAAGTSRICCDSSGPTNATSTRAACVRSSSGLPQARICLRESRWPGYSHVLPDRPLSPVEVEMRRDLAACSATLAAMAALLFDFSRPALAADPDGIPLSTAAGDQILPVTVSDGSGGAIVAWHDADGRCYAQRLNSLGVPQWTAGGVAL